MTDGIIQGNQEETIKEESILDKILSSHQSNEAAHFDPVETVFRLLDVLPPRDAKIIVERNGLDGQGKRTLEEVGNNFQVTRERIRQIEKISLLKIKENGAFKGATKTAEEIIIHLMEDHGGIMEEEYLLDNAPCYMENKIAARNSLHFIVEKIFSDKINKVKESKNYKGFFRLNFIDLKFLKDFTNYVESLLAEVGKTLSNEELVCKIRESEFYKNNKEKFIINAILSSLSEEDKIANALLSYLKVSKKIKENIFDKWGLSLWSDVTPKNTNAKIYLVLKKAQKPLHFSAIMEEINKMGFDKKKAHINTVHNELILDGKYVLVGRGIYALREWGYQPGAVAEVIAEILQKADRSLSKEEITELVLERRIVQNSTIYLALMNRDRFEKTEDGKYKLKNFNNSAAD